MRTNFTRLLKDRKKVLGIFVNTGCPEMVELAAQAGFQFLFLDNEHGSWGVESNAHLVRAAESFGAVPLVRVPNIDETAIKRALDVGAAGVVVPGISSVEEARLALQWSRFQPDGRRGACPYVRANNYTGANSAFFPESNREVAVVLLIEGKGGLDNFDAIISLDGVNNVFFGPYDMSVSLGVPGDVTNPKVVNAIKEMAAKANAKGVFCGMLGHGPEDTNRWFEAGIDYIAQVGDMSLYFQACKDWIDGVRRG